MVGGTVIEVCVVMVQRTSVNDVANHMWALRLWCVGTGCEKYDERKVFAEIPDDIDPEQYPKVGDSVWWQGSWIYYDGDRKKLRKIGGAVAVG